MTRSPILLTPGPLTTRQETRAAMLGDWGSRDAAFIAMTAEVRRGLLAVANAEPSHVAIPLQGSGTFIVEAAIATLVPRTGKLLVLVNGAYGERIVDMAGRMGLAVEAARWPEDRPVEPRRVDELLAEDPAVTEVALVHCETTTGLLNPLEETAEIVRRRGRRLLVDAMSSFGALPLDLASVPAAAVMASSNKCLEGVPGIGFAVVERGAIEGAEGNCPSLSLDLHAQWRGYERNGQWRFTPPVQVVAALLTALRLLAEEGGPAARLRRYRANCDILSEGMRKLGFPLFLEPSVQAPIIVTFHAPREAWYDFRTFYEALAAKGFVIYPGKLTRADSFRVGCIGDVHPEDMRAFVDAAASVVREMRSARQGGGRS